MCRQQTANNIVIEILVDQQAKHKSSATGGPRRQPLSNFGEIDLRFPQLACFIGRLASIGDVRLDLNPVLKVVGDDRIDVQK